MGPAASTAPSSPHPAPAAASSPCPECPPSGSPTSASRTSTPPLKKPNPSVPPSTRALGDPQHRLDDHPRRPHRRHHRTIPAQAADVTMQGGAHILVLEIWAFRRTSFPRQNPSLRPPHRPYNLFPQTSSTHAFSFRERDSMNQARRFPICLFLLVAALATTTARAQNPPVHPTPTESFNRQNPRPAWHTKTSCSFSVRPGAALAKCSKLFFATP